MGLFSSVARYFGYSKAAAAPRRSNAQSEFALRYAAARKDRLTADFLTASTSADAESRQAIQTLRDSARALERDDPLTLNWLRLSRNNVLGSMGLKLDAKVREPDRIGPKATLIPGEPDELANKAIEAAWKEWGKSRFLPGRGKISHASLSGRLTWRRLCQLALRSAKRDGECFGLIHSPDGNPYGFAIDLREADHLDTNYNGNLENGNHVRMGVEYSADGGVVAYHMFRHHPGDRWHMSAADTMSRERWNADRVIHLFSPKRISQSRGVPDNHAAMLDAKMLDGYNEAALVAARAGACQGGFFEKQVPDGLDLPEDEQGVGVYEVEPGEWRELPMGVKAVSNNPNYPHSNFGDFTKAIVRRISGALGISYFSLASDLESVNFSSARAGVLEDREEYMNDQEWFIEEWANPIFEAWLRMALMASMVKMPNGSALPFTRLEKFNRYQFTGRRWGWVDPLKDANAIEKLMQLRLTSRRREAAKQGVDATEVAAEIAADASMDDKHGLPPVVFGGTPPIDPDADDPPKKTGKPK